MRTLLTALLASALIAGCGGDEDSSDPDRPSGAALSFSRSGGLAATPETLYVGPDGRSGITIGLPNDGRRAEFRLTPALTAELQALARDADLASLAEGHTEPTSCADCYSYGVTYDGVRVERAEPDVAERLGALIARLQDVIDAHSAEAEPVRAGG